MTPPVAVAITSRSRFLYQKSRPHVVHLSRGEEEVPQRKKGGMTRIVLFFSYYLRRDSRTTKISSRLHLGQWTWRLIAPKVQNSLKNHPSPLLIPYPPWQWTGIPEIQPDLKLEPDDRDMPQPTPRGVKDPARDTDSCRTQSFLEGTGVSFEWGFNHTGGGRHTSIYIYKK